MITFGEIFYCEKVILNRNGSPREFINRFKNMHAESYPFLFGFSVVVNIIFSIKLRHWLFIRIRGSTGKIIFEGARQHIESNTPPQPNAEIRVIFTLENVEFPQPDDYTLYILLDNAVMHQDLLSHKGNNMPYLYLPNPEFDFVFIVGILILAIFAASF